MTKIANTIEYHINIPTDTDTITFEEILDLAKSVLSPYRLATEVTAYKGTEGHSGWRVVAIFNLPQAINVVTLVYQFTAACGVANVPLDAAVTAWIHPENAN
jgi:hypothetical protein